ncbi:MAG: S41 family peptidase [Chitinophagaceae bacterium]
MQRGILLLITPIILLVGCGKHEVRDPMEFTLPEATARQELTLAKDILYKAHPSINLYKSKERVDFLFDSIYQTFTQRTSLRKFYNSLYFITNEFGCSHTDLFMPPSFYDTLRNRNYFFPFPVLWVGNKMLVNIADFDTPQGTEIVSINGQPVKQLLKEISLYNSVEGIHRPTQLSLACRDFSFQYYLKFGPQKKFNLQIIDTSGKAKTLSLDPINYSEWETRNSSYIYYFDGTAVDYDFILNNEKGYGLIRIPTFEFGNGQKQSAFEHFCSNTFELLQKKANIKTLIIDLRENTGGKLYAAFLLFSYLAKKPFTEYERVISKVNSLPYSSYLDKDFAEREKAGLETSLRDEFEKRKTGPYYYYDSSFINKWEPDKYRLMEMYLL